MRESESGGSSAGVVAVLVIFVIIVLAALFLFGGRLFGEKNDVDLNISAPLNRLAARLKRFTGARCMNPTFDPITWQSWSQKWGSWNT